MTLLSNILSDKRGIRQSALRSSSIDVLSAFSPFFFSAFLPIQWTIFTLVCVCVLSFHLFSHSFLITPFVSLPLHEANKSVTHHPLPSRLLLATYLSSPSRTSAYIVRQERMHICSHVSSCSFSRLYHCSSHCKDLRPFGVLTLRRANRQQMHRLSQRIEWETCVGE